MRLPISVISMVLSLCFVPDGLAQASGAKATPPSDKLRSSPSTPRVPGMPVSSGTESGTPAPDLFVGAASYTYPLKLPQGRNSMSPQLQLLYRSDAGNGVFGVGWTMEFGSIERGANLGLSYDAQDFVFAQGKSRESLVALGNEPDTFVDKIESTFRRFHRLKDNEGHPYWVMTDELGTKYFFGQTSASRQDDPRDNSRIFKWCLDRIQDSNGNFITAEYEKEDGQIYLATTNYTGHLADLPPTYSIVFDRIERNDVNDDFQLGFKVRTKYLVKKIKICQKQQNGTSREFRTYELSYDNAASTLRSTLVSATEMGTGEKMSTTFSYGHDSKSWGIVGVPGPNLDPAGKCITGNFFGSGNVQLACLAATGTAWTVTALFDSPDGAPRGVQSWPNGPLASFPVGNKCFVGDFNADSRTDVACYRGSGVWDVALSTGSGWSTSTWSGGSVPGGIFHNACIPGDFNGDGRMDYACHTGNGSWQVSVSTGSGWMILDKTWDNGVVPSIPFSNACAAVDLNGDGMTDLTCHLGAGTWGVSMSAGANWTPKQEWNSGPVPDAVFSHRCVLGDFNGDGKADIGCLVSGGTWQIGLSTGSGWETSNWDAGPSPALPVSESTLVGDFNGDGKSDLLVHAAGWGAYCGDKTSSWKDSPWQRQYPELCQELSPQCFERGDVSEEAEGIVDGRYQKRWRAHCYKNSSDWVVGASTGSAWNTSQWSGGLALFANAGQRCVAGDFAGYRRSSVACFSPTDSYPISVMVPSGDLPDLLLALRNSTGGTATFSYKSSANRYNTQIPYVIHVLSGIGLDDGNGNTSGKLYDFKGGFFHNGEKRFRGFSEARVTQLVSEPSAGTGAVLTTETVYFHQGNETDPKNDDPNAKDGFMKGRPYRIEIADSLGKQYLSTSITYTPQVSSSGTVGPPYFNPVKTVETGLLDGNGGVTTDRFHYDQFLNLDNEQHEGPDTSSPKRTIVTNYVALGDTGIVGRPASREVFDNSIPGHPKLVAKRQYFYDDVKDDCSRIDSSQQIRGNLTRESRWLAPEFKSKQVSDPEEWNGYDAYGNRVCYRDARGYARRYEFDSSHTFITSISGPIADQEVALRYFGIDGAPNEGGSVGLLSSITDYNGGTFEFSYDGLDRIVRASRPDLSWTAWSYNDFGAVGKQNIRIDTSEHLFTERYFDGLGRDILTRKSGPNCTAIVTKTDYHPSGLIKSVSVPAFNTISSAVTSYSYDPLGRVLTVTHPDGSKQVSCYSGLVSARIDANGHLHRRVRDIEGRVVRTDEYEGTYTTCTPELNVLVTVDDRKQSERLKLPLIQLRQPASTSIFAYDVLGNLTRYQDPLKRIATFAYDSLSQLRQLTSPNRGSLSLSYDVGGNIISRRYSDSSGIPATYYAYDPMNRLVQEDVGSRRLKTAADWEFIYDEEERGGIGHLTTIRSHNRDKRRFYYDPLGRVSKKELLERRTFTTKLSYDDADRISAIEYPDNSTTTYAYNGPFIDRVRSSHSTKTILQLSGFTPFGQPGEISYGNGIRTSYTYCELSNNDCSKPSYRTRSITTLKGKEVLEKLTYDYDAMGNLSTLSDSASGLHSYVYDYDDRVIAHGVSRDSGGTTVPRFDWTTSTNPGQMIRELAISTPGTNWLEWWGYNAVGGLTFNSNIGNYVYPSADVVPADGPVKAGDITLSYSRNGALEKISGPHERTTLTYDADDQLVSAKNNGINTEFSYDWDGKRVERSGGGQKVLETLDDGYECIGDVCDDAIIVDGRRLAAVGKKTIEYYHVDDIGTEKIVSDGNGVRTAQLTYGSFGQPINGTKETQPFYRFAGNAFDGTSGLYYVGSRYYDSQIGMFITPDKMLFHGYRGRRWNQYAYALNNPLSWRDTNGYDAERTGWNRVVAGGFMIGVGVAGVALTPFTGGMSLAATFEVVGALSAGMSMASGIVTMTVGGVEVATGKRMGAEGQVDEALSTASGPAALAGELFSTAAGWNAKDRAAARSVGESMQAGLEFSRISVSILRSSGAFGPAAGQLGMGVREGAANVVSVGSYLLGKALPTDAPSKGSSSKEPSGLQGGPSQDQLSAEPVRGQTNGPGDFGNIPVGTIRYDRNGNELPDVPNDVGGEPDTGGEPDAGGDPE